MHPGINFPQNTLESPIMKVCSLESTILVDRMELDAEMNGKLIDKCEHSVQERRKEI